MYLSTSMFDNAVIFRGSFQSLRADYRHTNGVLLLWKKKDTSHVFLRLYPKDMSQLIASHWSAILFWNNDGKFPSDNTDNTPEQNANVDPPPGLPPQHDNNQDDDNNPEPFTSPHPPDIPMPDDPHTPNPGLPPDDDDPFHAPFQSPPRPNDDYQMRKCTHHKMNHLTYHRFHHHYRIIHNHRFPEPMPYLLLQIPLLCPIR